MDGLTAEEKHLVMSIAGPLVAESKRVEGMMDDGMRVQGMPVRGSADEIVRSLERDFRTNQQRPPQNHQQYDTPQVQQPIYQVSGPIPETNIPNQIVDDGQMEFRFDPNEFEKFNRILTSIDKKLTQIISLLSTDKIDIIKDKVEL